MNYYIHTILEPQGGYKMHKVGCKNMPMATNRFYLGNFFNALEAIQAAKKSRYNIVKICSDCISNSMKH